MGQYRKEKNQPYVEAKQDELKHQLVTK